jgi:hypothetical protein
MWKVFKQTFCPFVVVFLLFIVCSQGLPSFKGAFDTAKLTNNVGELLHD